MCIRDRYEGELHAGEDLEQLFMDVIRRNGKEGYEMAVSYTHPRTVFARTVSTAECCLRLMDFIVPTSSTIPVNTGTPPHFRSGNLCQACLLYTSRCV